MEIKSILYRKFCEVILLNDYYLIDKNDKSFFSLSIEERARLLEKKIQSGDYDILNDVKFQISKSNFEIFKNYHIKPLYTSKGFYLAIEVNSNIENGKIKYKPIIDIPKNLKIQIGIETINPKFFTFTNIQFPNNVNKCYFFSNQGLHDENTLSKPIVDLSDSEQLYQMGELARNDETIIQAIEDNTGEMMFWKKIAGTGFVNSQDLKINFDQEYFINWRSGFPPSTPKPLGIIEIQFYTDEIGFSIINNDGELNINHAESEKNYSYPKFELRFLSRISYWRYRKKGGFSDKEKQLIESSSNGILELVNADYVTKTPRKYSISKTTITESMSKFPNATPTSLLKEGEKIYSDIYFNSIQPVPK